MSLARESLARIRGQLGLTQHELAEKLESGPGIEAGIAQQGGAYYPTVMTTISLKLPENLLARLERESRARRTTKSSVVQECLTETT